MSRAASPQLGLFDAPRPVPTPAPPDPDFARKHLKHLLRTVRAAEVLPWSPARTASWEALFPQLAKALPSDEGRALVEAFTNELARLRSV